MAWPFCDRVDPALNMGRTAIGDTLMDVAKGRGETAKIEIRKTNLECPLESTKLQNGVRK